MLVHCAQGMSRSAAIVTAYLMLTNRWSFDKAYAHTREMRHVVRVNKGFEMQLQALEEEQRDTSI